MTNPKAMTIETALRKNVFCMVGISPDSFTNIAINENPNAESSNKIIPLFRSLTKIPYLQHVHIDESLYLY